MKTPILSKEEKERILRSLEEDREFRYALMGLLGFRELLDRFTRLEKRQLRLEEMQQRLEKRQLKLDERMQKLEERQQRLEERQQRLEERQQKLEERMIEVIEELRNTRRLAELNRRDIGALTEAFYTRIAWEELKEEISDKIMRRARNFIIDNVEVDLLIETQELIYIVEVKIQPNHHDINELLKKAELVRERLGKRVKPILAGTWIGSEIKKYAIEKNVKILIV